jgi:hypothetical protein
MIRTEEACRISGTGHHCLTGFLVNLVNPVPSYVLAKYESFPEWILRVEIEFVAADD